MNGDMDMEMGGEFSRLGSVLSGRRLPDGYEVCEGGCGKFVLGAFCRDCRLLNAQMEAKRLSDAKKLSIYAGMGRMELGVAVMDEEMPEPQGRKVPFTEDPLAIGLVGVAVLIVGAVGLWYGLPLLVELGLWLRAQGI